MIGWLKPANTLSNTWHESLGQKSGSSGRGTENYIRVLIVGSGPGFLGSVFKFCKFVPILGGTRLLRLKLIKAFFTGKIPGDCKLLKPRMFMET
jgi:hypothetical protein